MNSTRSISKKGWLSTLLAIGAFVVIFLIVRYSGFFTSVSFSTNDDGMTFTGPLGESVTVSYADVISIEYIESPDYGTTVTVPPADDNSGTTISSNAVSGVMSGTTKHSCRCGTWKSDTFGEYAAFTLTKIKSCALIKTKDQGSIVFNTESDTVTKNWAEAYNDYCKEFQ